MNQNIPFQFQSQLLQLEENEAFHRSKNAQWHRIAVTPNATCMNKHLGENHTAVCCCVTLLGFRMCILFINLANLYIITEKTNIIPALTQLSIDKAASIHQSIHASVFVIYLHLFPASVRVLYFFGVLTDSDGFRNDEMQ